MLLVRPNHKIAYDHLAGKGPCVIFCGGFNSNKQGTKALALEQFCRAQDLEYLRFDYTAHGESDGDFAEGTISVWRDDTLAVIDELVVNNDVVLVGSSMGGWLALLAAIARPLRVKGLLLIACATDMTRYYPARIDGLQRLLDQQERAYYSVENQYDDNVPYRIYQDLIDDGERWFLLDEPISIEAPTRLIHGVLDDVVPWQRSQQTMHALKTNDVSLSLIKTGDHRLSALNELRLIELVLRDLLILLAQGKT